MEQLFENMELDKSLVKALKKVNITVPTDIQQKAIPESLMNRDIIMQSSTGTGKTLAYLLPLFMKLAVDKKEMQALILVPTHELAIQVERQIELLSQNSDIKATSTPIIGDVNILRQIDKLKLKPHIIVGTAGRILELIQKKKLSAHTIKTIIIDEADRLLDEHNIDTIKAVIKTTLKERQIVMCSATISKRTIEHAKPLMKEPLIIESKSNMGVPDTIEHLYFVAEERDKVDVLRKLVRMINPEKAIAFFANSDDILMSEEKLQFHKLKAGGIHGSNIKADRKKTMQDFKAGKLQVLIASDIAARGLDIEGVTHIFNVHIPERSMDYLHRAGRTGRSGKSGMAISIVTEKEIELIKKFEKELKIKIIPKSMYNGMMVDYKKDSKKRPSSSIKSKTASNGRSQEHSKTGRPEHGKAGRPEHGKAGRPEHGRVKEYSKTGRPSEDGRKKEFKWSDKTGRDEKRRQSDKPGRPSLDGGKSFVDKKRSGPESMFKKGPGKKAGKKQTSGPAVFHKPKK